MIRKLKYRKWKKIIEKSGLFDSKYYLFAYSDIRTQDIDPIKHYVLHGAKEGKNPSKEFDTNFYLTSYPDVKESETNPLVHYILHGKKEDRKTYLEEKSSNVMYSLNTEISNQNNTLLQTSYELLQKNNGNLEEFNSTYKKVFLDYLKNHKEKSIDIPRLFSSELYKKLYPDMRNEQINPLVHYLKHGAKEGRIGYLELSNHVRKGKVEFDTKKETVVFVSHESSASGAPLLGFGIADKLLNKYNIVHIVTKEENIHDIFFSNCDLMFSDIQKNPYIYSYLFLKQLLKERSVKCVMINSIVGYKTMHAAYELDIPIVFLIHEFAEYMRPFGTMIDAILHSDIVVTPAPIIQNSIRKEFKRFTNHEVAPSNIYILPQGKLPYIPDTYGKSDNVDDLYKKLKIDSREDVKIIVGSGWVQVRKGVDLFVSVARYIKKHYEGKCKFVWVGEGFNPDKDLAYSVYLDREVEFSGLGDDFIFLEHQKDLNTIFSIADVFCLSSRMDPFPNVVIDALSHDLHIACFDDASGSAEFLQKHDANCTIVDFIDTYAMAEGISSYLSTLDKREGINRDILEKHLNFNDYINSLDILIDKAVISKNKTQSIVDKLINIPHYNLWKDTVSIKSENICRRYAENALKGISIYSEKNLFPQNILEYQKLEKGKKELCVLHIGMPKTGSSSLQEALFFKLKDKKVSYANLPVVNHGIAIYSIFCNKPEDYHYIKSIGFEKEEIDAFNTRNKDLLISGFLNKKSEIEIISGEDIYHLQEDEIYRLYVFLKEFFKKVMIVGYVRPPKVLMESAFQQYVKYHNMSSFDFSQIYHPYQNFSAFDNVFGKENVFLWKFDPSRFPKGDIALDFSQRLNIEIDTSEKINTNESISKEAMSILFAYHVHFEFKTDFGIKEYQIYEFLVERLRHIGTNKFRFSNKLISKVIKEYEEDYSWIQDRMENVLDEKIDFDSANGFNGENELLTYSINTIEELVLLLDKKNIKFELVKDSKTVAKLVDLIMIKITKEEKLC